MDHTSKNPFSNVFFIYLKIILVSLYKKLSFVNYITAQIREYFKNSAIKLADQAQCSFATIVYFHLLNKFSKF